MCSNFRGNHTPRSPWGYVGVLEKMVHPLLEPQIQEGQFRFHPVCGTLDQLNTYIHRITGGTTDIKKVYKRNLSSGIIA